MAAPPIEKQKPRFRSIAANALLMGTACVAALAGAEVILRVFDLAPAGGISTVTEREFEKVPGLYGPNQRLVDRRIPALPHLVTINALGYRGAQFPLEKLEGETRVIVVGDSFVYGDYVDDADALPARLEEELRHQCASTRVVNAGVGGSTIIEQLHMARRSVVLRPDLMLLVFSENDLTDLAKSVSLWDQLAANRAAKSRGLLGIAYPFLRKTALFQLALKARGAMSNRDAERNLARETRADSQTVHGKARPDLVPSKYAEMYRTQLAELQQWTRQQNIPLMFAVYPSHLTLQQTRGRDLVDWALNTGSNLGLPTIDLSVALQGTEVLPLYLLPHDGHPSPAGYRRAAGALADSVRAQLQAIGRCLK